MSWVAKDKNGGESIFTNRPVKHEEHWFPDEGEFYIDLPEGSIKALTNQVLTFDDEPIEL